MQNQYVSLVVSIEIGTESVVVCRGERYLQWTQMLRETSNLFNYGCWTEDSRTYFTETFGRISRGSEKAKDLSVGRVGQFPPTTMITRNEELPPGKERPHTNPFSQVISGFSNVEA